MDWEREDPGGVGVTSVSEEQREVGAMRGVKAKKGGE